LKRLQEAARNAGGELSEQAGEPENKESGETPKEQAKPKHAQTLTERNEDRTAAKGRA
jgi:hypothetical protein